jgi:hypothetical protein
MKSLITYATQHELSEEIIQDLTAIAKQVNIKRNDLLLNIGEYCNYVYIVTNGGFVSQFFDENRSEYRTTSFFLENYQSYMTHPESFFKKTLSDSRIKAFENSEVIAIHRKDIEALGAKYKAYDKFLTLQTIEALIKESQSKSKLISLPKDKLYAYLITHHNPVTKHVPSKYIAEFMGVTPQW